MLDSFSDLTTDVKGMWGRLSLMQRIIFLGVSVSVPIILAVVIYYSRPDYQILFRNLEVEDIVAIENELTGASIPTKQGEDGASILVPAKNVHRARLLLASEGLPRKKAKGYGLFDERKLGATEFEQQINYQRALQNELAYSIMEIEGVTAARVHLSIPKPTIFTEKQKPTKASVLLSLHSTFGVSKKQIDGIIHLVAWAVEGLDPENVALVDASTGRTLSSKDKFDSAGMLTTEQLEYQRTIEEQYEEQIVSMFQRAYGDPNTSESVIAIAKVSAEIDFDTQETTEETYDPNTTVVSEETSLVESADGAVPQAVGGMPGAPSNITPSGQTIISGGPSKYTRQDTTKSYMVSKIVLHKIAKPKLKRLSAAVMVNSNEIQAPLADLKRLVESAIGYDNTSRNDLVEVILTPFFVPKPITIPEPTLWEKVLEILKYPAVIVLIAIIGLFLLLRLFLGPRGVKELPEGETPALAEAKEKDKAPLMLVEAEERKQQALVDEEARKQIEKDISDIADERPEVIENIIKYWLENDNK